MYHPAAKYEFVELYKGLNDMVAKGYVIKKVKGELELYCYSEKATYEKVWNDFTRIARGIILCPAKKSIVALPFPKFFNVEEGIDKVPNLPFSTYEKLDGSLAIVYYWDGKWNCATKGSFESEQAIYVEKKLLSKLNVKVLDTWCTYLFEYIAPHNKIVIAYEKPEIRLLGAYDNYSKKEFSDLALVAASCDLKVKRAISYDFSNVQDILEKAKTLPLTEEGYVLKFSNGLRLKAKGAEYCRVHKLISNLTPLSVWEAMASGSDLEEYKKQLPEEFYGDFDAIYNSLQEKLKVVASSLWSWYITTKDLTDKELGLKLHTLPDNIRPLIFNFRKNKKESVLKELYKQIRPTGNML